MKTFRKDFNSCKTVSCRNFGVIASKDYIYQSQRLGYLSVECKACGSNPPWVNNGVVSSTLDEKLSMQLGRKISDCPACHPYFFITDKTLSIRHGYTSAGIQRKKCCHCQRVFSLPHDKNMALYKVMLEAIFYGKSVNETIKSSGLSARLYYFYLDKIANLFRNFSRQNEETMVDCDYLALHTQGKVLHLAHQRGFYNLITSENDSGYVLLQSNNLTKQKLNPQEIYNSDKDTIITSSKDNNIERCLIDRYQQNLQRKHFEQLLIGPLKALSKCHLMYPNTLAYMHFQLLTAFTHRASHYNHYIEHESCLRSAALMASYDDIVQGHAGIYFVLPFADHHEKLKGREIGWWKDKWFSNDHGAYCAIVGDPMPNHLEQISANNSALEFHCYLDKHLNKNINSLNVIDNLSEIHRVIFNYCEIKNKKTRAMILGVCEQIYTPSSLLEAAFAKIMSV